MSDDPPALPRGIGGAVIATSALVALSGVAGIVASVANAPAKWFLFGFELVALVAGVVGITIGVGRSRPGPALGLLCVAGAIASAALLGYLGAGREVLGTDLRAFMLGRFAAAGVLGALAAAAVLIRRPAVAMTRLLVGIGCAAGFAALVFAAWKFWPSLGGVLPSIQAIIGIFVAMTALGLLAAAVHMIVQAFAAGAVEEPGRADAV